jgi:predicted DNA-binding protein (UPF0251 family)/DNA-directed RNA polymerase subunit RPC12/RpoP
MSLKCRAIAHDPECCTFGPLFSGKSAWDPLAMTFDESEAIRLADVEGLYQEEAARQMQVSHQNFSNILESARRKAGEMLVLDRNLNINEGKIMVSEEERSFGCAACGHRWSLPYGVARPAECPSCSSQNLHRMSPGGGFGGGKRGGGRCRGFRTGLQKSGGAGEQCCQGEGDGRMRRNREAGGEA